MNLKLMSANWPPFCLSLNVTILTPMMVALCSISINTLHTICFWYGHKPILAKRPVEILWSNFRAETPWPIFYVQRFQMRFAKSFLFSFQFKFHCYNIVCSWGPTTNSKLSLDQVMAWCRTGDKPLSEPMLTQCTGPQLINELTKIDRGRHCINPTLSTLIRHWSNKSQINVLSTLIQQSLPSETVQIYLYVLNLPFYSPVVQGLHTLATITNMQWKSTWRHFGAVFLLNHPNTITIQNLDSYMGLCAIWLTDWLQCGTSPKKPSLRVTVELIKEAKWFLMRI